MKRIISIMAVVLVLALLLVSCSSEISGRYYSGDKSITKTYVEYNFSARKVHITAFAAGTVLWQTDAEYSFNSDKTQISIKLKDNAPEGAKAYAGDYSFEQGEDYIRIGIIKYNKD